MSATRPRDADRVWWAIVDARLALNELRAALAVWGDSAARDAEARQGAAAGAADPSKDAELRAALDALAALGSAGPALEAAEALFADAEAGITAHAEAEPEL